MGKSLVSCFFSETQCIYCWSQVIQYFMCLALLLLFIACLLMEKPGVDSRDDRKHTGRTDLLYVYREDNVDGRVNVNEDKDI